MPAIQLIRNNDELEVDLMGIVLDENNKPLSEYAYCYYNRPTVSERKRIIGESSVRIISELSTRPIDFVGYLEDVSQQIRWDHRYRIALILMRYIEETRPLITWKGSVRFVDDTGRVMQTYSPHASIDMNTNAVLLGIMYPMTSRFFSKNGVMPIIREGIQYPDILTLIGDLSIKG